MDIVTSDGCNLEDSLKARQNFTRKVASSFPLPPPKNGIFKMLSKARLQNLLATIANKDEFYKGLDEAGSEVPPGVTRGGGPQSFEPSEGSPPSQPPGRSGFSAEEPLIMDTLNKGHNRKNAHIPFNAHHPARL